MIIACFKNLYIINYNRKKKAKEKIFGKKKVLKTLEANINQIKLITIKQKSDADSCDYYNKEHNIFYTDLDIFLYKNTDIVNKIDSDKLKNTGKKFLKFIL